MDLLITLLRSPGLIVSKKELMAQAWPHAVVDDAAIRVQMSGLRRLLGDGKDGRRYIINVTQRGYQFIAPVMRTTINAEGANLSQVAPHTKPINQDWLTLAPFGRRDDCVALYPLLFSTRCLTLTGGAGVGKSTMAKALANARRSCSHANACNELHYDAVSETAGSTNGLHEILATCDALNDGSEVLLVLDNCEHRINEMAQHTARLIRRYSNLRILATSREPLRIDGETVRRISPLGAEAAAALFVQRCRAGAEDAVLGPIHAEVVADICRRLDFNPLALELAALRAAELGIGVIGQLLADPLQLLTRGRRTAPQRHQSMRAAIDWSYALLSASEREALHHLSKLNGRFSMLDARTACGSGVLDELGALLACSLLQMHNGPEETSFSVPCLVRSYALHSSSTFVQSDEFAKLCNV
jgi:predicted ATPase